VGQVAGADFLQPTPAISATVDAEKRSKRRREVKPEGVGGMSEIDCMSGMIGKSGGNRERGPLSAGRKGALRQSPSTTTELSFPSRPSVQRLRLA